KIWNTCAIRVSFNGSLIQLESKSQQKEKYLESAEKLSRDFLSYPFQTWIEAPKPHFVLNIFNNTVEDFHGAFAENFFSLFDKRRSRATPAKLTMLSTGKRRAIRDSPVALSLVLIRSKPYAVLACPNAP
ncbi:MAG: hypothetical protein Q8908_15295, partial [Bacteroidota bacterium]|nr:hypothetical protein [Bacteroidota bacterium]